MSKRAVSKANVSSKRSKLGRELVNLEQKDNQLAFQRELASLTEQLKQNPSKLKAMQLVMDMDSKPSHNDGCFNLDLEGRSLSRVPMKFLVDTFLPNLPGGLTSKDIKALSKGDSKVPLKMLYKLAVCNAKCPLWPMEKTKWATIFTDRVKKFDHSLDMFVIEGGAINWQKSGLWKLLPELPADIDPQDHIYESIVFLTFEFPLSGDTKFRGTWSIEESWDLEAKLVNPSQPWARIPCSSFLTRPILQIAPDHGEDLKVMKLEFEKLGAIEDKKDDMHLAISNIPGSPSTSSELSLVSSANAVVDGHFSGASSSSSNAASSAAFNPSIPSGNGALPANLPKPPASAPKGFDLTALQSDMGK